MNQQYALQQLVSDLKQRIESQGRERRANRLEEEREKNKQKGQKKIVRSLSFPQSIGSIDELNKLIAELIELKNEMALSSDIEISIVVGEKN